MKHALKLLVLVIFVTTMTRVHSTELGDLAYKLGLIGEEKLLKLSLLGKEKKRTSYTGLASQLTLEANIILEELDQHLVCDCDFESTISVRVSSKIKLDIIEILNTLAQCDKDKKAKEKLKVELTEFEFYLQNLEVEINSIQRTQSEECRDILRLILESLNKLKCVASKIIGM